MILRHIATRLHHAIKSGPPFSREPLTSRCASAPRSQHGTAFPRLRLGTFMLRCTMIAPVEELTGGLFTPYEHFCIDPAHYQELLSGTSRNHLSLPLHAY